MSVINKMLRDLDKRQTRGMDPRLPLTGLAVGAVNYGEFAPNSPKLGPSSWYRRIAFLILACIATGFLAGAAWWVWQRTAPTSSVVGSSNVASATVVLPATSKQQVASAPSAALPTTTLITPTPAASAPAVAAAPIASTPAPVETAARLAVSQPPAAATSPSPVNATDQREPVAMGLRLDNTLSARKLPERSAGTERASAMATELPKGPTPNEALERAQALWNSGSRDSAIDLLQDAVVVAERTGATGSNTQGNPVLMPLVRELTRMQLAEARFGAVWDLLTRLEPQLGTAPDFWAIRGNAAQRLGRHQDSVLAYMTALQSRPNEQRWLLGAAVSLAALGQIGSAAEMAEKARALGVVTPEVLAYFRQMGVPLSDK